MHGVPDDAEPPSARWPTRLSAAGEATAVPPLARPVEAVLFDLHGTLAQVEDAVDWVCRAATECGVSLDRARATALADRLVAAGRPGGPPPRRVPPHLIEVWAERDLDPYAHRAAYTGLAESVGCGIDGLPEALYARLHCPQGWSLYADTLPTLRALRAAGLPVGVVTNIGFDVRALATDWGMADLVDAWALSYEVGRTKPDAAIFRYACAALGVPPERVLMVGDTPADAGAVAAGCAVLILPAAGPGEVNGLGGVLALTQCDSDHG